MRFFIALVLFFYLIPDSAMAAPVANHAAVNSFPVPPNYLPSAATSIAKSKKLLFMHQSTGGYILQEGLGCLAGLNGNTDYPAECTQYASFTPYTLTNWNWPLWFNQYGGPQADAIAKMDQFVSTVNAIGSSYDVIGMKYCYVDGWNQSDNVDSNYYINQMLDLERRFPGKTFIWATSALWSDPGSACGTYFNSCAGIAAFNQQVRLYAAAHNKPLFDIADIESDGGTCKVMGYEGLCSKYYSDGGGHPTIAASIRLAKGFWWLVANLDNPAVSSTPIPKPGDSNSDGSVDGIDYVTWLNHYGQNVSGSGVGDFNSSGIVDGIDYVIWLNNYGL